MLEFHVRRPAVAAAIVCAGLALSASAMAQNLAAPSAQGNNLAPGGGLDSEPGGGVPGPGPQAAQPHFGPAPPSGPIGPGGSDPEEPPSDPPDAPPRTSNQSDPRVRSDSRPPTGFGATGWTICNRTGVGEILVAISWFNGGEWEKRGWMRLPEGDCLPALNRIAGGHAYYFAMRGNRRWEGGRQFCVLRTAPFVLKGRRCPVGYELAGFRRVEFRSSYFQTIIR